MLEEVVVTVEEPASATPRRRSVIGARGRPGAAAGALAMTSVSNGQTAQKGPRRASHRPRRRPSVLPLPAPRSPAIADGRSPPVRRWLASSRTASRGSALTAQIWPCGCGFDAPIASPLFSNTWTQRLLAQLDRLVRPDVDDVPQTPRGQPCDAQVMARREADDPASPVLPRRRSAHPRADPYGSPAAGPRSRS